MKKHKLIFLFVCCLFTNNNMVAQFNTIKKEPKINYVIIEREPQGKEEAVIETEGEKSAKDTLVDKNAYREIREKAKGKSLKRGKKQNKQNGKATLKTEGLTISSLYEEIIKNNIQYPKIVLAQAILETGWFRSNVCRYKGNLFGLTNPRTGQYYEFDDWRESVKAYYDKVQYRYKGGNYLLWLKKIGYAEDPRYISSVMDVLEKHIL